jgi:transcriptional regulator GlxA family with amidase domain
MVDPRQTRPVTIMIVAVPEISAGIAYNLCEAFSFVGKGWEILTGHPGGPRRMLPRLVGPSRAPFRNGAGLTVAPEVAFADSGQADIVIVPDLSIGLDRSLAGRWPEASAWVRRQHAGGALVCSVCTGALVLADAGLLDGIEATCHWAAVDHFRRFFPNVALRPERLLVTAGAAHRVITAGGPTTWSELALYLIARFCGEEEARRTAKVFILGDKSDGQLPFAARVRPRQHDDAAVGAAQEWIAQNYACDNPVAGMTRVSGLAPRTFVRRFKAATGYAPLDYVQSLRIEEAKQMLETSDQPVDAVAAEAGYAEPAAFRRIFKRLTGVTPSQYRQRFGPARAA